MPIFAQFDFSRFFSMDFLVVMFAFLFVDIFDTLGTLIGVATKADMLDAELKAEMKKDVPSELPVVFISAVTNQGISELKDLIWKNLH